MITNRKTKVRLTASEINNGDETYGCSWHTIVRRPQKDGKQWVAVVDRQGQVIMEETFQDKSEASKVIKGMNRMMDKCAMGGKMSDKSRHRIKSN